MIKVSDFSAKVFKRIRRIPAGHVSTYVLVARAIGHPGAARAVGNALNKNPYAPKIPCHRVVKSNGEVGDYAFGAKKKSKLLQEEGVKITRGKIVNFENILYKF